jgi:ABC-type glycerol-3-phosphate transport system permease component
MGVLLESERRSFKARVFLSLIYFVLILGAVTMVYPFMVMLSASFSANYDYHRHSPVVTALFDRNDRFMRSIAVNFRVFPHEVYPDAPKEWTNWALVAKDREGVDAFAARELAPYDDEAFLAQARVRAEKFMRTLAEMPASSLTCNYDPRDVPGFVKRKYGTVEALNAAWPIRYRSFFDVSFSSESKRNPSRPVAADAKSETWDELKRWYIDEATARGDYVSRTMPYPLADYAGEVRNALAVQFIDHGWRDFFSGAFANYRLVGDYLFLRGRAFANTILLVVLTILASLTVNPLAAYALSRFRMRSTEKVILFLLATMAFPAAVTAIPGFLLIRDLGMLNTFAALVLPSVASGMSIFILKGFFDALPRELYEAAAIDGAGEWTVFTRITLPMTTPILAVNALNSFIHAYSSWEWAFLVCQKESHWTLAVWMYQMSQTFTHQPWCVMAGFVLVSLPTAVVFLLCQKVILRGIVLPSMK